MFGDMDESRSVRLAEMNVIYLGLLLALNPSWRKPVLVGLSSSMLMKVLISFTQMRLHEAEAMRSYAALVQVESEVLASCLGLSDPKESRSKS